MADPKITPILEIATGDADNERPPVSINGVIYYLKLPKEFGLVDQGRLRHLYDLSLSLNGVSEDTVTMEQRQLLSAALQQFVQMVVIDLPHSELLKFEDRHALRLIESFGKAVGLEAPESPPQNRQERRKKNPTGTKLSPVSNTSTAEVQPTG